MRERLFRGKRIDSGEWVYGCLVHGVFFKAKDNSDIPYIFNIDDVDYDGFEDFAEGRGYYEVYPETIGMCVPGITDKNGKRIFEGDIVWETVTSYYQPIGKICYNVENCQWRIEYVDNVVSFSSVGSGRSYELLGNMYDNPELLLEENNEI